MFISFKIVVLFVFWFVLKVPQFERNEENKKYHNFKRNEDRATVLLKWTDIFDGIIAEENKAWYKTAQMYDFKNAS